MAKKYKTYEAYNRVLRRRAIKIKRSGNRYARNQERLNNKPIKQSKRKARLLHAKQVAKEGFSTVITNSNYPRAFRDLGILGLVFMFLLIAVIFRISNDMPNPSFQSFINLITNSPVASTINNISLKIPSIIVGADVPDIFQFIITFINGLASIINFLLWLVQSVVQIVTYIFYFLAWLLGMA